MKECSKSIPRRLSDSDFLSRFFSGNGIDIGGKPDPLYLYHELFPLIEHVRTWDIEDGDAQIMESVDDESFDFVHSSHCLEHLVDPEQGLKNWFRIIKPGGHLIFTVPDEDLYEQGVFPSTYNKDHRWTFTLFKEQSWSERSINIIDLVKTLGNDMQPLRLRLLDSTYRYRLPRYDQTLTPTAECGIEVVIRKRTDGDVETSGKKMQRIQLSREMRIHLNQYLDDQNTLRQGNSEHPPFENDNEI